MNTIINAIEDAIVYIAKNKEVIIAGTIVAIVMGLIMGLIMIPFFA